MEVKIQISDSVYAELLNGNKRIKGSIALVSPKKGNFNAHSRKASTSTSQYMKLPHGRVSVRPQVPAEAEARAGTLGQQ